MSLPGVPLVVPRAIMAAACRAEVGIPRAWVVGASLRSTCRYPSQLVRFKNTSDTLLDCRVEVGMPGGREGASQCGSHCLTAWCVSRTLAACCAEVGTPGGEPGESLRLARTFPCQERRASRTPAALLDCRAEVGMPGGREGASQCGSHGPTTWCVSRTPAALLDRRCKLNPPRWHYARGG